MTCAFVVGAAAGAAVLRARWAGTLRAARVARHAKAVVAQSPDALVRYDAEGRCTFASPAAARVFALPPDRLAGRRLDEGLSAEDRAAVAAAFERAAGGWAGAEAVIRTTTAGGDALWIEARLTHDPDNGGFVAVLRDVTTRRTADLALRVANAELTRLAGSDPLTDLANRRRFDQMLDSACRRGSRQGTPVSVLLIEIDGFETYARRYGHPAADGVLKRVAGALRAALPDPADLVARFAGEEFAVMLPGRTAHDAEAVGEHLRTAIAALGMPHLGSPEGGIVTASVGAATADPDRDTGSACAATLVAEAGRALPERRPAILGRLGGVGIAA